jgi:hypothetical protein
MATSILQLLGDLEPVVLNPLSEIPYEELIMSTQTFGRVYLPSVYGKDLSSFEIASSGKIALSLNDMHAMDVIEEETLVMIQPIVDNSIALSLTNDRAHVSIDGVAEYVDILAADVFVSATDLIQIATGPTQDAVFSMQGSNMYLTSTGVLAMSTANQQAYVNIDTALENVNIYSSNDCTIHSKNEVVIKARSMKIEVDEFSLSYTFRPTSTGALNLVQSLTNPDTGLVQDVVVARFGTPIIL